MSQRPTINLVDNPVAVGGGEQPETVTERPAQPAPPRSPRPRRAPATTAPEPKVAAAQVETNPYAQMRKVQAPVRLFPPLWDRLEQIVRELRDEGLEVDKTALLNAVLHFDGPADAEQARDLVNRWRALLARPPARRR
jgi:hypothetical protein